jgi:cytochrome P450
VQRKDILSQLLDTHRADPSALTMDEIIAITTTNVIAGSDTTAVSLASVLYHLGKYPAARHKLQEEIERAEREGLASNPITYAEAVKLPYLSAVIHEAMRIHPATGFILERLVPEGGVTLHGVHLPEGTVVGVNAWVLHRNKDVFGEDVHSFRPERWIEGEEAKIKEMKRCLFSVSLTSTYVIIILDSSKVVVSNRRKTKQFGYGPRSCVGKNISILEMWKVVFELYRHFDITLASDREWTINGSWFTPQRGIEAIFKPRT